MLVNEEQYQKASSPIEVTPLGISMLVNEEQSSKAELPIEVTEYSFPEIVTVDGIVTSVGSPEYPETLHSAGVSLVTVNSKSSMMTLCAFNPNPEINNAIISKIFFIIYLIKWLIIFLL